MKIFEWEARVNNRYGFPIADGYVIAENVEEAKEKIKTIDYGERVYVVLDNEYGSDILDTGVVVRWEE